MASGAHGGYVAAVALRAMSALLQQPERPPRPSLEESGRTTAESGLRIGRGILLDENMEAMAHDRALLERMDSPNNAEAYEALVSGTVLPGIAARDLDGYHGAYLLRRDTANEVEFATIMLFDSIDHVRAFAGDNYETAYVPPAAREVLARFDE